MCWPAIHTSSSVKYLFVCIFVFKSSPDRSNMEPANPLGPSNLESSVSFEKNTFAAVKSSGQPVLSGLPGGSWLGSGGLGCHRWLWAIVSQARGWPCLFLRSNGEKGASPEPMGASVIGPVCRKQWVVSESPCLGWGHDPEGAWCQVALHCHCPCNRVICGIYLNLQRGRKGHTPPCYTVPSLLLNN